LLWSSTAILAPLAAMARAVAAPETGATAGDENGNVFNCMIKTFPWAFLLSGRMASSEWRMGEKKQTPASKF